MTNPTTATESIHAQPREKWPRIVDWLDALVPVGLRRRNGFPHDMRVEEFNRNGSLIIRAEIPGIELDTDLDISVCGRLLTISGTREEHHEAAQHSEFFYGRFMRTLTLPTEAVNEDISASYQDGILEIVIPMQEPQTQATRIPVART